VDEKIFHALDSYRDFLSNTLLAQQSVLDTESKGKDHPELDSESVGCWRSLMMMVMTTTTATTCRMVV
jgi:hypothetical protein